MRMISSGNRRLALALMELRAAYSKEPGAAAPAADEQLIEAADTLSLRSLDGLRVYARTIQTFSDQMLDADIKALARKTFVFAATDDRTVSIHSTRRLCRMLPKAHPYEYPTGGHFAVFVRDDLREQISHVIDARQRGAH
jgi:pimeloyl-ACP methyl ester carboxylesterase